MLAAMLLNQKALLVSPSISIPMCCHGARNDYHLPSVSKWWTWKTLNVQLIIFSLHIMSNSTHKQSSSLIFMTKTGSLWKWPYENLKWTDYVHSLIQKLHFSSTTDFFQQSFYWFTFPDQVKTGFSFFLALTPSLSLSLSLSLRRTAISVFFLCQQLSNNHDDKWARQNDKINLTGRWFGLSGSFTTTWLETVKSNREWQELTQSCNEDCKQNTILLLNW